MCTCHVESSLSMTVSILSNLNLRSCVWRGWEVGIWLILTIPKRSCSELHFIYQVTLSFKFRLYHEICIHWFKHYRLSFFFFCIYHIHVLLMPLCILSAQCRFTWRNVIITIITSTLKVLWFYRSCCLGYRGNFQRFCVILTLLFRIS